MRFSSYNVAFTAVPLVTTITAVNADAGILTHLSTSLSSLDVHDRDLTHIATSGNEGDITATHIRGGGGGGGGRMLQTVPSTLCSNGYVDCVNGFIRGNRTVTCASACAGKCCVGNSESCTSFTGLVCMDGSCNGFRACRGAKIPRVINSCKGDDACSKTGAGFYGYIGNIVNSCDGKGTRGVCYKVGYSGNVKNVTNSCTGYRACYRLGSDIGQAKEIRNSCIGERSCYFVGNRGSIGSLVNSCQAVSACARSGNPPYSEKTSSSLTNCCSKPRICERIGGTSIPAACKSTVPPTSAHPTSVIPSSTSPTTAQPVSSPTVSSSILTSAIY